MMFEIDDTTPEKVTLDADETYTKKGYVNHDFLGTITKFDDNYINLLLEIDDTGTPVFEYSINRKTGGITANTTHMELARKPNVTKEGKCQSASQAFDAGICQPD